MVDPAGAAVAEAAAFADAVRVAATGVEPVYRLGAEAARRRRHEGGGVLGAPVLLDQARERTIPGRGGDITIRVMRPPQPRGIYLHIHGGGWVLGGASEQDQLLWDLACATACIVVAVEYRLAPEHPFPAAVDDCEDVAAWLVTNAKDVFGLTCMGIGGESAGAHLAVMSLLRLRDAGHSGPASFVVADLSYGAFDLSMTPSQLAWGDEELVISTPTMAWFYESFLPEGTDRRAPHVSPLYAALHGMPPAIFTVGMLDPLLDDSLFMAARWESAGNLADLRVYPQAVHGFTLFPLALGRIANTARHDFITRHLTA